MSVYCSNNKDLQWVIFEGDVYDVKEYIPLHPGGADLIEPLLG